MKREIRRTPAGHLYYQLVHEVFRFNGQLLAAGDWLTKELNLSGTLWQVLDEIDKTPLSVAQIARNMWLTRQSVRRTAMVLKDRGFVEFQENPHHRRAKLVTLTRQGRDALDRITRTEIGWSNNVGKDMGPAKLEEAVSTVRSLRELLHRRMISAGGRKRQ